MRKRDRPSHDTFAVATWIVAYTIEHGGNSPYVREIAAYFDIGIGHAQYLLDQMYKFGIAKRIDNKLIVVGVECVPPQWYIENIDPPVSDTDQSENARHNHRVIRATSKP